MNYANVGYTIFLICCAIEVVLGMILFGAITFSVRESNSPEALKEEQRKADIRAKIAETNQAKRERRWNVSGTVGR